MPVFTATTTALSLEPGAIIRITPDQHHRGTLPPTPTARTEFALAGVTTSGKMIRVIGVLGVAMVIEAPDGRRWLLSPLKPTELNGVPSYPEGSGATDWIVRSSA
jgi:hypothetical protein